MKNFSILSLFTLLQLNASLGDISSCPVPGIIYEERRHPGTDFYDKIDKIGLMQCCRECSLITICLSVNYDKEKFTCYLYNFQVDISAFETDTSFVFINDIARTKELMGSCSYNKCSREEMCVELNSSPVCVKLGCRHKQYTFDEMTKTCFRILTTPLLRWRDASEYCKQDGARLIKLDTREKNDLITEALINGYHDHGDLYYWNDGSELRRDSYKNWGYLQPDNNDPDCNAWRVNCITIQNNGKWFDSCCNLEKGFICEII